MRRPHQFLEDTISQKKTQKRLIIHLDTATLKVRSLLKHSNGKAAKFIQSFQAFETKAVLIYLVCEGLVKPWNRWRKVASHGFYWAVIVAIEASVSM